MSLPKRRVGKTRLEVTTLGLGGAPMGGFRATIPETEAVALTDAGYEAGIRYFDTSPFYGYGRSELRKAGIIGAIGVGINESDTSLRFIQAGDFDCMLLAGRYTLLEQGGLEAAPG